MRCTQNSKNTWQFRDDKFEKKLVIRRLVKKNKFLMSRMSNTYIFVSKADFKCKKSRIYKRLMFEDTSDIKK